MVSELMRLIRLEVMCFDRHKIVYTEMSVRTETYSAPIPLAPVPLNDALTGVSSAEAC